MKTDFSQGLNSGFFRALYGNCSEGYLELRSGKKEVNETTFIEVNNIASELPSIIKKQLNEKNIYFGAALRREQGRGKKEDCSVLTALYADIDVGEAGHKKKPFFNNHDRALAHIRRIPLKPSIIVNSGHGLHAYWLLQVPIIIDGKSIEEIESANSQLQFLFGGDSIKNVDRILRVPGTYNFKVEPPVECKIVELNNNLRYGFEEIKTMLNSDPLLSLPLEKISKEYYYKLFGQFLEKSIDRSQEDQSLITHLLGKGFSKENVIDLFTIFPTTGKFMERHEQEPKGAEQYLLHSIEKAEKYLEANNDISNKNTKPVNQLFNVIRAVHKDSVIGSIQPYHNSTGKQYEAHYDGNLALQKSVHDESAGSDFFTWTESGINCGYYYKGNRLSNFIVKITKQISSTSENKHSTFIDGEVIIDSGTVKSFKSGSILFLSSVQKMKEFLLELCGLEARFLGSAQDLIEAIKLHNALTEKIQALDYGYDENLEQYITPSTIIDKSGIIEKENYMIYSTQWQNNYLQLQNESQHLIGDIKTIITEKLIPWDEDTVSLLGLGFTFLPLIYPYLRRLGFDKPYMLLTGDSGSGKSTMLIFYQRFFGNFKTLLAVSSTATSLEIMGHSMKDSLIGVDDLKLQILNTENKRNNFITMLQNYSDNTSRNRANTNLEIRDKKNIRGMLMMSGEDYVISEASTLARGILINVNKKAPDMKGTGELQNLSKDFSFFTSHYLHHIFNTLSPAKLETIQSRNINWLERIAIEKELVGGNLPRIINNFAQLKTSWDLLSEYLFDKLSEAKRDGFAQRFETAMISTFEDNFERVHKLKTDLKFEEILWTLVDNNTLIINNADSINSSNGSNVIGRYKIKRDNTISLGINLRVAYKYVNDFMKNEGGIGLTYESLVDRLTKSGKITAPKNNQLTIGLKQFRGYYWIKDIPYETLGLTPPVTITEERIQPTNIDENDLYEMEL